LHLVGILFPHINDDARSKSHQICTRQGETEYKRINPNFTATITGQGKTRAYLHRFKIIKNVTCPCYKGDQTIDHFLNQCTLLQTQRELLRNNVLKFGNWRQQGGVNNETIEIISYFYKISRL